MKREVRAPQFTTLNFRPRSKLGTLAMCPVWMLEGFLSKLHTKWLVRKLRRLQREFARREARRQR